mmetsp:Transcript_84278/g.149296  ORF Transcript_84278/g.149296 Transcript_84278/m.149296 type:complete len:269 (+) Transcript_84278:318-1124(+)
MPPTSAIKDNGGCFSKKSWSFRMYTTQENISWPPGTSSRRSAARTPAKQRDFISRLMSKVCRLYPGVRPKRHSFSSHQLAFEVTAKKRARTSGNGSSTVQSNSTRALPKARAYTRFPSRHSPGFCPPATATMNKSPSKPSNAAARRPSCLGIALSTGPSTHTATRGFCTGSLLGEEGSPASVKELVAEVTVPFCRPPTSSASKSSMSASRHSEGAQAPAITPRRSLSASGKVPSGHCNCSCCVSTRAQPRAPLPMLPSSPLASSRFSQ